MGWVVEMRVGCVWVSFQGWVRIGVGLKCSLRFKMQKSELSQESGGRLSKDQSKGRQKFKELLTKQRDHDSMCLNQSELKHMHAIRPFCTSKDRKSTRRESKHQSPYVLSRSKSKRLDHSAKKDELPTGKPLGEIYNELISLKSEYKMLKNNYSRLVAENGETLRKEKMEKEGLQNEKEKLIKEGEKQKKCISLLEIEVDRIKKECYKILEMERFKLKKLQETLQQKELMIAYLRNQLDNLKKGSSEPNQPLYFLQNSTPLFSFDYFSKPNPNISALSNIPDQDFTKIQRQEIQIEQDSLSFSRDKSKQMDSIIHSFLSNHDQSHHAQLQPNFIKKENILISSLEESPIDAENEQTEEKSEKSAGQGRSGKESKRDCLEKNRETISVIPKKSKVNAKRLQIIITDENLDSNNFSSHEEISNDTKKRMMSNSGISCRQKKKMTVKKPTKA